MNSVRILFLAANPKDTPQIRVSEEIRTIDERLRTTEFGQHFKVEQCWALRIADLPDALLRYTPQIVHFSGHGSASGQIILEDKSGMAQPVSPEALSDLFEILTDDVQLVVLNACYSESQARAITQHVRCVVGMSRRIDDLSAIAFAAGFYRGLGWGRTVETSFRLGCNEIDLSSLKGADKPALLVKSGIDPAKMYLVQPDIPTESEVSSSVVTLGPRPGPFVTLGPRPGPLHFGLFAVILGICAYLAWRISERVRYTLDETSFWIGITVAAVTGFIWFLVSDWWSTAIRPGQISPITTIRAYTPPEAANKIRAACFWAIVQLLFFVTVVIVLIIWAVQSS